MNKSKILLLLSMVSLSACIGVNTSEPLCKDASLADVRGLEGPIKSSESSGDLQAFVHRLAKGIYWIEEQNPPRDRPTDYPQMAIRFCRVGDKIYSEYQLYQPESEKLQEGTFWPHLVRYKGSRLELYFLESSIDALEAQKIPYSLLENSHRMDGQPAAFTVLNTTSEIDQKLSAAMSPSETVPSTVFDVKKRFVLSPVILY